jgi:hypothetical protein
VTRFLFNVRLFFSIILIAASRVSAIFVALFSYHINFLVPSNLVTIYTVSLHAYVHVPTMDDIIFPSKHSLLDDLGLNPLCARSPTTAYIVRRSASAKEPFQRICGCFSSAEDNRYTSVKVAGIVSVPVYRILTLTPWDASAKQ